MKTKKVTTKTNIAKIEIKPTKIVEAKKPEELVKMVYVGASELAKRIGYVTGKEYIFKKDQSQKPQVTKVNKRDIPALLQEKGRGCFRRDPQAIFILKTDWDQNC